MAVFPCAMLLFWIERCRIRWLCLSPPPFPHLILLNEQICCCGTAERCTATLRLHHSPISSPCQRRSSGSKQQRSPATSFACVVTCAWSPDPTQQPTSFAQKLKCSQTGAKTPYSISGCPFIPRLAQPPPLPPSNSSFPTSHWPTHTSRHLDDDATFDADKLPPRQRDLIGCPKSVLSGCMLS